MGPWLDSALERLDLQGTVKWSDCKANRNPKGIFFIHNLCLGTFCPQPWLLNLSLCKLVLWEFICKTPKSFRRTETPPAFGFPLRKDKPHLWEQIQTWRCCFRIVLRKCLRTVILTYHAFNIILQVLFMIPVGLSIGVISSFQIPAFCNNSNLLAVFLLLLLFG